MNCRICASDHGTCFEVPYERLRHQDFTALGQGGVLHHCNSCGAIQNISRDLLKNGQESFSSTDYSHSHQNCQTIKVAEFEQPLSRSFLQAEVLAKRLPSTFQNVLDIGCFDGELLKEIQARCPGKHYHGFDINPYLAESFPKDNGFKLYLGDFDKLQGPYDLITLSHSIMYFTELPQIIETINSLLGDNGRVFIQTPNLDLNPCNILLADQCWYFNKHNLQAMLAFFGMTVEFINADWFPREIMLTAKLSADAIMDRDFLKAGQHQAVQTALSYLMAMENELHNLSENNGRIYVLGTTVNAAFADGILQEKCCAFVDENNAKVGGRFRGKQVLHPKNLQRNDVVVLPYGHTIRRAAQRMTQEYHGDFFVV